MKMFHVTLSREVSYREDAIVTIEASDEDEARELAEEGHFNCIYEQEAEWKFVSDSNDAGEIQITSVEVAE
jgi:hypothetical protein